MLEEVRNLDVETIAESIEEIGFECTDCGACCRGDTTAHTATVFPDEIRALEDTTSEPWRDVVRPMPFGLDDAGQGETIEWAIQTDDCGDCRFHESAPDGSGSCSIYADRPSICRTYPFTLEATPGGQPLGDPVDTSGPVIAHECEGLGRDISSDDAIELAQSLLDRGERAIIEAMKVSTQLNRDLETDLETVVVDSEGYKHPTGEPVVKPTGSDRPLTDP